MASLTIKRSKAWKLILSIDQFFSVAIFDANEDETMSSYIGRNYHDKWQEKAVDGLFRVLTGEKEHCANNIERQFLGVGQ